MTKVACLLQRWSCQLVKGRILAQDAAEALRLPGSVSLSMRTGLAPLRTVSSPVEAGVKSKSYSWDEMG